MDEDKPDPAVIKPPAEPAPPPPPPLLLVLPPQPFASWALNEDTCLWDAPTPMPQDGKPYKWDEPTTSWVEIVVPA